jgi:hypothetical protein
VKITAVPNFAISIVLVICAIRYVSVLWGDVYLGRFDLATQIHLVASAHRELLQGQWLLSFVNETSVAFQPFFRYYAVLPYVAAGLVQFLPGLSAYEAALVIVAASFVVAGLGMMRLCNYLRIGFPFNLAISVGYAFSPYAFDNLFARGAYPEFIFDALVPFSFYGMLRCYASAGRRWFWRTSLLWTCMILTHKIVLPWLFACSILWLVIASWRVRARAGAHLIRIVRCGAAVGVAVGLAFATTAPYWLEAQYTIPRMPIASTLGIYAEALTEGLRIFWPLRTVAPIAPDPIMAFQLGAPATVGLALAIWRPGRFQLASGVVGGLVCLFICGGAAAWVWLPSIFKAIQFPYRLLSLATLFGTLSLGLASARISYSARRFARPVAVAAAVAPVVLVFATMLGFNREAPTNSVTPASAIESADAGELYLHTYYMEPTDDLMSELSATPLLDARWAAVFNEASARFYERSEATGPRPEHLVRRDQLAVDGFTATAAVDVSTPGWYVFPVQFSRYLHAEELAPNGTVLRALMVSNVDAKAAVYLDSGTHRVRVERDWWQVSIWVFAAGLLSAAAVLLIQHSRWRLILRQT